LKWKITSVAIVAIIVIAAAALFAYFNYGTGIIEIKVSDPALPPNWGDATQVYLNYSAIEIHRSQPDNESGWQTVIDESAWINLTRTLDVNQTIGAKNLQAGAYNLIRFRILEAIVTIHGVNRSAVVPSGRLTVAILRGGIHVNSGHTTELLIDISVKVVRSGSTDDFNVVPAAKAIPA